MTSMNWNIFKTQPAIFISAFLLGITPLISVISPRSLAAIPVLIVLLGYGLDYIQYKATPHFNKTLCLSFSALCALLATSYLWSIFPDISTDRLQKTIPMLIALGLMANFLRNKKEAIAPLLPGLLSISVLLGAAVLCIDLYADSILYRQLHPDAIINDGNLSHLNRSCVSLALLGACAILLNVHKATQTSFIMAACVAIALTAIIIKTDSQSAQLALIVMALTWTTVKTLPQLTAKPFTFYSTICILCTIMLSAPWLSQLAFNNLSETLNQESWLHQGYAGNRLEIWDFISRKALESPLLGHGLEATRVTTDFDIHYIYHKTLTILHPHNFIVQIWYELGLAGITLIAILLTMALRALWNFNDARKRAITLPIAAGLLITATISYGIWQGWWLGLIGLLLGIISLYSNKTEQEETQ